MLQSRPTEVTMPRRTWVTVLGISYFRHQTDTGLPRGVSYFRRSCGLPVPTVISIDWRASMTERKFAKFHHHDVGR